MVGISLILVILAPAFVASFARCVCRHCNPNTLAVGVAVLLLALGFGLQPDRFKMVVEPIRNFGYPVPVMIGLIVFLMAIQIALTAIVARIGVAIVDRLRS